MYVKTMHALNGFPFSNIYTCHDSVRFGTVVVDKLDDDWPKILKIEANAFGHMDYSYFEGEKQDDLNHVVKWAWWWVDELDHSIEYAVTNGKMFVLNEGGSTIEQVR